MPVLSDLMSFLEGRGWRPRELYTFARGNTLWRYTSANAQVAYTPFGGSLLTYVPALIMRDRWARHTADTSPVLHIKIARTTPLAAELRKDRTSPMYVGVHRYQDSDTIPARIFYGYLSAITYNGGWVEADIVSGDDFEIPFPSKVFTKTCQFTLGSFRCGVNEDLFTVDATITALGVSSVTVDTVGGNPDGYYKLGRIKFPNTMDQVTITNHIGLQVSLLGPVPSDVIVGDPVKLVAGDDRTIDTCTTRFSNWFNFGGYPFLPIKNPFDGSML